MARAARRGTLAFGPVWLGARLAQLLPHLPQTPLCVAFSGGADSTALLSALAQLKHPALKVRAVHVDHQLHPEHAHWSAHCRRIARALGVPVQVRRVRVARARGDSPEATARRVRYQALAAGLKAGEALLTAHHADDQLETVLLQLLRGAGVAGIAAMPAVAPFAEGFLVRPLLEVPHQALAAWVRAQGLDWVEDDGNAQAQLDRSYLRVKVLPLVRARWPAAAATVARSARHAAEAQRLLDALGAADAGRASVGAALSARVLRTLAHAQRRNALRYWIGAAGFLAPPSRRLEQIAGALLAARADAQPQVRWEGACVTREADLLWLRPARAAARGRVAGARAAAPRLEDHVWRWQRRRTLILPAPFGTLTLKSDPRGPLDLDALAGVLKVRGRRGGERLRPVPGGPRRALKGLLQQARVPLEVRARLPLIFAGAQLVAAADLWLDESLQASAASARRARLIWRAPA